MLAPEVLVKQSNQINFCKCSVIITLSKVKTYTLETIFLLKDSLTNTLRILVSKIGSLFIITILICKSTKCMKS